MKRREFLKHLAGAAEQVTKEISATAAHGKYGGGLAHEGYAGGYLQALRDVDAMLTHGCPSDPRGYWGRS